MKKMKRIILAMVVTLAALLLAGCGNGLGRGGGVAGAGGFEFTGYPMYAPGESVSFFTFVSFGMDGTVETWEDSPFFQMLREAIGVDVDWQFPVAGAVDQQAMLDLMIMSGDLPDVIFSHRIMPDAERLLNEGVFRDLTPFIEDYAPNYFAFLQEKPVRDRAMKTDDGRYFAFGFFREEGSWADSFQGPLVRQDWLDELGLPTPTTVSDWDNTLRAFHENYDATFATAWGRFNGTGFIAGAFGAHGGANFRLFIDPRTNTVQLANVQPEWRDFMAHMNGWWNEGLINQDLIAVDDAAMRTMTLNDQVGLTSAPISALALWTQDAEEIGSPADWRAIPWPTGDDGTLVAVFGGPGVAMDAAGITSNVSDDRMELVMRVLDFGYSREGFLQWNFGTEGYTWNMVDGTPTFSDVVHNQPDGIHHAMLRFSGTVWGAPSIQSSEVLRQRHPARSMDAQDIWFFPNPELASNWVYPPRGMALSAEEAERAAQIQGALSTFVNETTVRFLTGADSLDNFDSFVAQVEAMDLAELLALHQAAYERFLAR